MRSNRMATAASALVGACLLASCAALPRPGEAPALAPVVVHTPPEAVWDALPTVYEELGLERTFEDPDSRTYGKVRLVSLWTPWIGPMHAPYVRCTVTDLLAPAVGLRQGVRHVPIRVPAAHVTFTVATTIRPADSGTEVETRVSAVPTGSRSTVGSGGGFGAASGTYCVSTGRLEARIQELLAASGS